MAIFHCTQCFAQSKHEMDLDEFEEALAAMRSRRYLAMLDELERVLPSEFVGLADDIIKWAGKTR